MTLTSVALYLVFIFDLIFLKNKKKLFIFLKWAPG